VDNGGLTITIQRVHSPSGHYDRMVVEDSYYGYSDHILNFNKVDTEDLRKFADAFLEAATKIEGKEKVIDPVEGMRW